MGKIVITTEIEETFSSISNNFIDYYMADANGDFVKIYLYLVRLYSNGLPISVSDIADHFNCNENDVCRAIRYWISVGILRFQYDEKGEISGIILLSIKKKVAAEPDSKVVIFRASSKNTSNALLGSDSATNAAMAAKLDAIKEDEKKKADSYETLYPVNQTTETVTKTVPEKRTYSSSYINEMNRNEEFSNLVIIAEAYFKRSLTHADANALIYIYEELKLPYEVIEYLLEHCATVNQTNSFNLTKNATKWYEEGIKTKDAARNYTMLHNEVFKKIFRTLGVYNRTSPTAIERQLVDKWQKEYSFSDEIIIEACKRANLSSPNNATFPYVNGILESWHKSNVRTLADIERLDKEHLTKTSAKKQGAANNSGFNSYMKSDNSNALDEMTKMFIDEVNNGNTGN